MAIAAWVIGLATTVGFFGVTGVGVADFAGAAGLLVLVVGIAAETLSSGASAFDEVSNAFVLEELVAAVFLALGSGAAALFAGPLFLDELPVTGAADDVVVEDFTVAVFDAFVFAFVFAGSTFFGPVLEILGVTAFFADVLVECGVAAGLAPFVAFVAVAFVAFAAGTFFAGAFAAVALVAVAFFGAAAFFAVAAGADLDPVSFFAAAVTLLTADLTPPDFVAVFLAVVGAALGMRSTSQAVRAAPP